MKGRWARSYIGHCSWRRWKRRPDYQPGCGKLREYLMGCHIHHPSAAERHTIGHFLRDCRGWARIGTKPRWHASGAGNPVTPEDTAGRDRLKVCTRTRERGGFHLSHQPHPPGFTFKVLSKWTEGSLIADCCVQEKHCRVTGIFERRW
jgi:hypothetical protein